MKTNNKYRKALKLCIDELCNRCLANAGLRGSPLPCLAGCETVRKAKAALAAPSATIGNSEKVRRALIIVYDWILKAGNVHGYPDTEQKRRQLYDMMTKALAAPPRNCDKCKNADEAVVLAIDAGVVDCNFGAKEMAEFLLAEAKGDNDEQK